MAMKYTAALDAVTVLSTEMDNLAHSTSTTTGISTVSSIISNNASTERYPYCLVELFIATQALARTAGGTIDVAFVPSIDATNWGSVATTNVFSNYLAVTFVFDAATTSRRIVKRVATLPNADFKVCVLNKTGRALAGSGNILKISQFGIEDA